jgi:GT2 family glycosyltransferase
MSTPFLSVVVPAHRGEGVLRHSLPALLASELTRSEWELIVVDDASPDDTALVAAEYADVVVRLVGQPRGPAYARNRGVEVARGEVVVFVDADVCVHADALSRMASAFRADVGLSSLFGSYDTEPAAPGVVSRFRNLLHHHTHQRNAGPAETFWAGCGAVRRQALLDVGLMDAWHFPRPQIEDIELGRRLRRAGHRIELRADILCTHLKRWTLRSMLITDFRDRGAPWMQLLLAEGAAATPATLNLRISEKVCTLLAGVVVATLLASAVFRSLLPLAAAALAALVVIALNRDFHRLLLRTHGVGLAVAAVPLHLLFYFTGGLAGVTGAAMHYAGRRPTPRHAAAGPASWPPSPDRPAGSIWTLDAKADELMAVEAIPRGAEPQ